MHRTGTAHGDAAAKFRASETYGVAYDPEKGDVAVYIDDIFLTVD
jgi:hypothetical protein